MEEVLPSKIASILITGKHQANGRLQWLDNTVALPRASSWAFVLATVIDLRCGFDQVL